MGTLFAFISLLLMFGSIVAAFKPSLINEESRLKAFVFCWVWAIIATQLGMVFDGKIGWSDVAITSAILGVFYVLLTYIIVKRRIARMPPKERAIKLSQLMNEPYKSSSLVSRNLDDEDKLPLPQSYTPAETKGVRSVMTERFARGLTTLWSGENKLISFEYINSHGEFTQRQVSVDEISFSDIGSFYLSGFCHLRKDNRLFKVDNIQGTMLVDNEQLSFDELLARVGVDIEIYSTHAFEAKLPKRRSYGEPIPWAERVIYENGESKYFVLWEGTAAPVEFTINRKRRVSMTPQRFMKGFDGDLYLAGTIDGNAEIVCKTDISSMLKSSGASPLDLVEWAIRFLGFKRQILKALPLGWHPINLEEVWSGECAETEFTYGSVKRERIKVIPIAIYRHVITGDYMMSAKNINNTTPDNYQFSSILTMLKTDGEKKLHKQDWLQRLIDHEMV